MSQQIQVSTQPQPTVAEMLNGALLSIQSGSITQNHVDVLKGMMDLMERNEQRASEKEFAKALTDLQGESCRVSATKAVDQKSDGSCRYRFAPYEAIMKEVQPMLTRNGFSITFDTETSNDRLTSICTLTHSGGHSRSNRFAVRYGKPPGSSDAQGDMSTKSYAKRGALCDALNIVVDHDDDGRALGEPITQAEAEDLRSRCKAADVDEAAFLKYAQATGFEAISRERLEDIEEMLLKKEIKAGIRNRDGSFPF